MFSRCIYNVDTFALLTFFGLIFVFVRRCEKSMAATFCASMFVKYMFDEVDHLPVNRLDTPQPPGGILLSLLYEFFSIKA